MATPGPPVDDTRLDDPGLEAAMEPLNDAVPAGGAALTALQAVLEEARAPQKSTPSRYTLLDVLGRGGMGVVWLARDEELQRNVALKQLTSRVSNTSVRLDREARAIAQIAHPNVVAVFDVALRANPSYIVMEYVEGSTLRTYVDEKSPRLGWRRTLKLYQQVARGLSAAHDLGLVHRDFKPDNAMVDGAGVVKVLDFGLAKALPSPDTSESDNQLFEDAVTRTGTVLGTPAYMSPQQHAGAPATPRDDIYSFGVSLWEALYGSRPFLARDWKRLAAKKRQGPPAEPDGSEVPSRVYEVLARALAPVEEDRWGSMRAVVRALKAAARPSTRRWWAASAVAVAAAAGLGLSASSSELPACDAAVTSMQLEWASQRERMANAASVAAVDRYVAQWASLYAASCTQPATRASETTRACLDAERLRVFPTDTDAPVLPAIPSQMRCADHELARMDPPPSEHRAEVEALQRYVVLGNEQTTLGHPLDATLETNLARARRLAYRPLLAQMLSLVARARPERGTSARVGLLEESFRLAEASGADRIAMRTASSLADLLHQAHDSPEASENWLRVAYALSERVDRRGDAFLDLANAHALIELEQGSPYEALDVIAEALASPPQGASPHLLDRLRERHASALTALRRHRDAADLYKTIEENRRKQQVGEVDRADALGNLGVALQRADEVDAAIGAFETQLAVLRGIATPPKDQAFHEVNIARGLARRPRTRAVAIELLRGVVEQTKVGTDLHARASYSLGEAYEHDGDRGAAATAYETAALSVDLAFGPDSGPASDVRARIASLGSPDAEL